MLYFFLIMLGIILMIMFLLEKDLFSPPCLLSEVYIISVILILIKKNDWGVTIRTNTIEILLFSTILFSIVYVLTRFILIQKKKLQKKDEYDESYIEVKKMKVDILIIINILVLVIYVVSFLNAVGGGIKFQTFSSMMHYYRLNTAYGDGLENEIPGWVMQLKKINWATAYVFLYIAIYNYIYCKKNNIKHRINYKYIILIILYLPLTILSGGRFDLIVFFISILILWYIMDKYFYNSKNIDFSKIIKIIFAVFFIVIIFSMSRTLVGRNNESSFVDYIAMYFGAPIVNFDQYINTIEDAEYETFGREIFKSIYNILEKIFDINLEELTREFVVINGNKLGNVYTAYKYMYSALGIVGIIIFQSLLAIVFAIFYTRIKNLKNLHRIRCDLIIYSIIIYAIILHPFSEFLFSTIISFNYFLFLVILMVLRNIVIGRRSNNE